MIKSCFKAICISLGVLLSLTACGMTKGPRDVVEQALTLYTQKNYEEFNKFLTETSSDFNPETTEFSEAVFDAFSNLEYEIKESTVTGATAEVIVSVTTVAMRELVIDLITESFNMQFSGEAPETESEIQDEANDRFDRMISDPDAKKHTGDVTIQLEKYGSDWKIVTTKEFINAMTCFKYGAEDSESKQ